MAVLLVLRAGREGVVVAEQPDGAELKAFAGMEGELIDRIPRIIGIRAFSEKADVP